MAVTEEFRLPHASMNLGFLYLDPNTSLVQGRAFEAPRPRSLRDVHLQEVPRSGQYLDSRVFRNHVLCCREVWQVLRVQGTLSI